MEKKKMINGLENSIIFPRLHRFREGWDSSTKTNLPSTTLVRVLRSRARPTSITIKRALSTSAVFFFNSYTFNKRTRTVMSIWEWAQLFCATFSTLCTTINAAS
ncbi:hypothetical protein CEXT_265431 [Caerostris extrusa]|uniref:Uncharacterized protein n=1 Tax=Caerostris extrusa TaxID=172846 RepID=A0AAV4WFR5_CAEEX|nr:hypothetical protein CEXT_265431 [Caerostris extrusa]